MVRGVLNRVGLVLHSDKYYLCMCMLDVSVCVCVHVLCIWVCISVFM